MTPSSGGPNPTCPVLALVGPRMCSAYDSHSHVHHCIKLFLARRRGLGPRAGHSDPEVRSGGVRRKLSGGADDHGRRSYT